MIPADRGKADGASLVSAAIGAITRHIRVNEMAPGDRLPSETALSKELNVSRTVIREAFQSLSAMRLIELSAGRRATVSQLDHGAMSMLIEHGVHTEQINIQQIYDVRRTIEMRTTALAALRRSDAEAQSILTHAQAMEIDFDDPVAVMEHDLAFHLQIAKASRNPVFWLIVGAFQDVIRHTWPVGWKSRASDAERHMHGQTHIAIGEAIAAGNPQEASQLMAKHFDDSIKALLAAGVS